MKAIIPFAWAADLVLVAQSAGASDWTHIASLPFAFAAASFLIWSLVALLRLMFEAWAKQGNDTIATLRDQIALLTKFQDETLLTLVRQVSKALEKEAEASSASVVAWGDVHKDFRELITEIRIRPCMTLARETADA